jgi:hypothetical protein
MDREDSDKYVIKETHKFTKNYNEVKKIEETLRDPEVLLKDLVPVDLNKSSTWVVADGGREFVLNFNAIEQLGNSRKNAALRSKYANSLPNEFQTFDINGNPITVNLKDIAFIEAVNTVPETVRIFREASMKINAAGDRERRVLGVVSRSYPKDFSNVKLFEGITDVLNENGIKFSPTQSYLSQYGTFGYSLIYKGDEFKMTAYDPYSKTERTAQAGSWVKNNMFGEGTLAGGPYGFAEVCSNGMLGFTKQYAFRSPHKTNKSLLEKIVDWLRRTRNKVTEDRVFGIEVPSHTAVRDWEYYAENMDEIYHPIGVGLMLNSLIGAEKLSEAMKKAIATYVNWGDEITAQASKYKLGKTLTDDILEVGLKDNTLNLVENRPGSMYDVANAFTSTANYVTNGDHQVTLREIGAEIFQAAKPITAIITV